MFTKLELKQLILTITMDFINVLSKPYLPELSPSPAYLHFMPHFTPEIGCDALTTSTATESVSNMVDKNVQILLTNLTISLMVDVLKCSTSSELTQFPPCQSSNFWQPE